MQKSTKQIKQTSKHNATEQAESAHRRPPPKQQKAV